MTAARFYSSTAGTMELQSSITDSTTTIAVDSTTGLPGTTPFTLVIDPGTTEEIVTVTGVSGVNLTVTRGVDGSPAQAHDAGASIRHMATARDFREPQEHIGNTVAHGTTGDIVGDSDTQTLTNKDLTDASNTFPSTLATDADLDAHTAATAAHGATGAVVGTTNTQALSNKDLSAVTNIFPTTLATDSELASHAASVAGIHGVGAGTIVGTTSSQVLANKVMSGANNTFTSIPQTAVTALTSDLASLDTRLDTAESDITALEADVAVIESTLTTNDGRLDDLEEVKTYHTTISITPSAANTPTSEVVNLSGFATVSAVQVTPLTTVPGTVVTGWGASSITASTVTIWVTRTNTTATGLMISVFGTAS